MRKKSSAPLWSDNWQNHRAKTIIRDRPSKDRLRIRRALDELGLRYWEMMRFYNPHHKGWKGTMDGGWQWVDFIVHVKGNGPLVLFVPINKGSNERHKRAYETKKQFMSERGIPFFQFKNTYTEQEVKTLIEMKIKLLLKLNGFEKYKKLRGEVP